MLSLATWLTLCCRGVQDEHAKLDTTVSGRGRWNDIDQKRTVLTAKLKLLKEKEGKLLLKRMDQATYSQGIFALVRHLPACLPARPPRPVPPGIPYVSLAASLTAQDWLRVNTTGAAVGRLAVAPGGHTGAGAELRRRYALVGHGREGLRGGDAYGRCDARA